jgi:hypothetical protein
MFAKERSKFEGWVKSRISVFSSKSYKDWQFLSTKISALLKRVKFKDWIPDVISGVIYFCSI